ncbi:hypothetical protein L3Q70_17435 (plasmid) [Pseudoalteromonas sp. CF6-2]|uniref:hypothetical protein n=1 Tax=Pseudoalteromonas sp. CF6-2 TaxID=562716 RepID=UPI001F319E9D|nr:hypothetical protein L3Q70_17435 [Pseudoalteromonas sp. CF6-2]
MSFSRDISESIFSCNVSFRNLLDCIRRIESQLPEGKVLIIHTALKDGSSNILDSSSDLEESDDVKNIGIQSISISCSGMFSIRLGVDYSEVIYNSTSILGQAIATFAISSLSLNTGNWFTSFNNHPISFGVYYIPSSFLVTYSAILYGFSIYTFLTVFFSFLLIILSFKSNQKVKIIMKNDTDNFFIRKKEDLATNSFFTFAGLILGYFLGKL